jgi:hypothetical protein
VSAWPPEPDVIASEGSDYRERFLVVDVHRDDLRFTKPRRKPFRKTSRTVAAKADDERPWRTAGDAIGDFVRSLGSER